MTTRPKVAGFYCVTVGKTDPDGIADGTARHQRMPPSRHVTLSGRTAWDLRNGHGRSIVGLFLRPGAAIAAVQFASPYIIKARGETPIRIGMVDPITGVYAAIAQGEVVGAKFAAEELNKKGGILGRPVELLIEDSANDVGTGVQKARKLIDRDQVELHHRRRQFRHRDRRSRRSPAKRRCFTSSRAVIPIRSPARAARGMYSGSATRPPWTPTPSPPR